MLCLKKTRLTFNTVATSGGSSPQILGHSPMASAVARAYNGGPPGEVQGQNPWSGSQGQNPPEAEVLLVFRHSMEAVNLSTFLKFGNANKSDICAIFAKNYGWPRNWGA